MEENWGWCFVVPEGALSCYSPCTLKQMVAVSLHGSFFLPKNANLQYFFLLFSPADFPEVGLHAPVAF